VDTPSVAPDRVNGQMNVTPMLDVMLVLLVIFMVVALGERRTIDAQLPLPCSGSCEGDTRIVLEVLPGPTYRLNQSPVPPSALAQRLEEVYAGRPDRTLQVAGHGVSYQQVISAMDVARGAGVRVIGLMAPEAGGRR
jgi:biopolymer transport protein ExbD